MTKSCLSWFDCVFYPWMRIPDSAWIWTIECNAFLTESWTELITIPSIGFETRYKVSEIKRIDEFALLDHIMWSPRWIASGALEPNREVHRVFYSDAGRKFADIFAILVKEWSSSANATWVAYFDPAWGWQNCFLFGYISATILITLKL